jgi:hypothetical protein
VEKKLACGTYSTVGPGLPGGGNLLKPTLGTGDRNSNEKFKEASILLFGWPPERIRSSLRFDLARNSSLKAKDGLKGTPMADINPTDFVEELKFDIKTHDLIKARLVLEHLEQMDQGTQKLALLCLSRAKEEFVIPLIVGLLAAAQGDRLFQCS